MSYLFPKITTTVDTTKILLYGNNLDLHILQLALNAASTGNQVWFITPEAFKTLPTELGFPDKEILKLIRFFYLKDCFDVLKHLNQLHSWMQVPFTLILHKINDYVKSSYDIAGFLMSNLIECINYCHKRCNMPCYLILACESIMSVRNILQMLINLYIDHVVHTDNVVEVYEICKYL